MSAYLIFDPQNNLIFSSCDQTFRQQILESQCDQTAATANNEDNIRNLLCLYLTPLVVIIREMKTPHIQSGCIPSTLIVHQNLQQFIFMHLSCSQVNKGINLSDLQQTVQMQRKVNLFSKTVSFLYGHLLFNINTNLMVADNLRRLIDTINETNYELPVLIESVEKLHTGMSVESLCKEMATKIEQQLRLELPANYQQTSTFQLVLFKEKLIFNYNRNNFRLKSADLLLIMLLTVTNDLIDTINNDIDCSTRDCYQCLVFLESAQDCHVHIPYIYRKVFVNKELCVILLTEVPFLLTISLSTVIRSINDLKHQLEKENQFLIKSIKSLINSLENLNNFMVNVLNLSLDHEHLLNVSPLIDLIESFKRNTTNKPLQLIIEQCNRILSMIKNRLYLFYQEVIVCELFNKILPKCIEDFRVLNTKLKQMNIFEHLQMCSRFIEFQYFNNQSTLTRMQLYPKWQLKSYMLIDRLNDYFFLDRMNDFTDNEFQTNTIIECYKKFIIKNKSLVSWADGQYRYIYFRCKAKIGRKWFENPTAVLCEIISTLMDCELVDSSADNSADNSGLIKQINMNNDLELFCIFEMNSNIEQNMYSKIVEILNSVRNYLET